MIIRTLLTLLLLGALIAADPDITAGPPAKASPSTPGWGFYPGWAPGWRQLFNAELERNKQGNIEAVFLGDSLTMNWNTEGKAVWAEHFAPLKAVNYGVGADSTRQVLWRIEHGVLDGISPKLVVVAIGTNNLYNDFNGGTDAEITAGVKAVVDAVHDKLPQAKILIVGILPRQNAYFCGRIVTINAALAKLDNGAAMRFVDPGSGFLATPGPLKTELFTKDLVHISAAGYQVLAAAIKPAIEGLLK